jgi:peptidoglycan/LPS O-acetylase OafA/YrhL
MRVEIRSLQYGRALASLAVVTQHSLIATTAFVGRPPAIVEAIAGRGFLGVDFFFVLSGFIIMHAHINDDRTLTAAAGYFTKRLRRIYIPYLPISAFMIGIYLFVPSMSRGNHDWGVLTSLTLFPTVSQPALIVAWTLVYEIMFYVIFSLYFFIPYFRVVIASWAMAILFIWSWGTAFSSPAISHIFSPLNLEFIAGAASAYVFPRIANRFWPVLFCSGLVSVLLFLMMDEPETYRVWFGISLAHLITGLALLERSRPFEPIRWLLLLGNASYAIYLVHDPVVSIFIRGSAVFHSWTLSLSVCIIAGVAFGVVYHYFIEKPAIRLISALPIIKHDYGRRLGG